MECKPVSTANYHITDGEFAIFALVDGESERCVYQAFGSAGALSGRNNPSLSHVRNVGPLPQGLYWVRLQSHPRFRAPAFRLLAYGGNEMHGRSGFWIHGGTKSEGCILLPPDAREAIIRYRVRVLQVCQ